MTERCTITETNFWTLNKITEANYWTLYNYLNKLLNAVQLPNQTTERCTIT